MLENETCDPVWFVPALNPNPEENPESRDYVLGHFAAFAPPPDLPPDPEDRLSRDCWECATLSFVMDTPEFWRGFLDARATIGQYPGMNGKRREDMPSLQLRCEPRWLDHFILFLVKEDWRLPRDSRSLFDTYRFTPEELTSLRTAAERGRLACMNDQAQKILWLVYRGVDGSEKSPCSPKNIGVVRDILLGWTSRNRRKLLKRGWAVNIPEGVLRREKAAGVEPVVLEFEPSAADSKEDEA